MLRFCVDFRRLSTLNIRKTYPLPRMDECLYSLAEAQYFTSMDCNSGYWQLLIASEDTHRTAFVSHAGNYQFVRMPFLP